MNLTLASSNNAARNVAIGVSAYLGVGTPLRDRTATFWLLESELKSGKPGGKVRWNTKSQPCMRRAAFLHLDIDTVSPANLDLGTLWKLPKLLHRANPSPEPLRS